MEDYSAAGILGFVRTEDALQFLLRLQGKGKRRQQAKTVQPWFSQFISTSILCIKLEASF
jgi:hypothetical protein